MPQTLEPQSSNPSWAPLESLCIEAGLDVIETCSPFMFMGIGQIDPTNTGYSRLDAHQYKHVDSRRYLFICHGECFVRQMDTRNYEKLLLVDALAEVVK